MKGLRILAAIILMFLIVKAGATEIRTDSDRTLSPYFYVPDGDNTVDNFALKSTAVDVSVAGTIADVQVTQVYSNAGKRAIEAIYVFPASTKAAVYAMKMTIGERVITASIKKAEEARQTYEDAKAQGKTASLLEQERPNVFQMNVANIQPGDLVKVELNYTESLVPDSGVYEFVYPTVVGPRYSNQSGDSASDTWIANPYLEEGILSPSTFDVNMKIGSGMSIKDVACRSHKVDVTYIGKNIAKVKLAPEDKNGGNRDFIVDYRLADEKIDAGLLLYEGKDENFFLVTVEPPVSVAASDVTPREYVFVLDVSGSMHGFPLDTAKQLMNELLGTLKATDRFNVVLFSGSARVLSQTLLEASEGNIRNALAMIAQERGGGGTELLPAIKTALSFPRDGSSSRIVVVVTDGFVSVEKDTFDYIRNNGGKINLFAFGIGSSVNRYLIDGMARAGMGEPFIVTRPEMAAAVSGRLKDMIASPVLANVSVEFTGFKAHDVEPPAVPDLFKARPVVVFGKWDGAATGTITVKRQGASGKFEKKLDVSAYKPSTSNEALRYLWARKRIETLGDFNKISPDSKTAGMITDLGLKYSLLTDYTSFVAVDSLARGGGEQAVTVKQPLPLPQGVSNYAVGGMMKGRAKEAMLVPAAAPAMSGHEAKSGKEPMLAPATAPTVSGQETRIAEEATPKRQVTEDQIPGLDAKLKDQSRHLVVDEVTAEGGLSKEDVESVINAHLNDVFNVCLTSIKQGATVTVAIEAGVDGKVISIKNIQDLNLDNAEKMCLEESVKKLVFRQSDKGTIIRLTLKAL